MAPLMYLSCRRVLLVFSLLFLLFVSVCFSTESSELGRRRMLEDGDHEVEVEDLPLKKKTTTIQSAKNKTKLIKPSSQSPKNQTKTIKSNLSSKNQTKLILTETALIKKLNSTSKNKKLNSTSKASTTTKSTGEKQKSDLLLKENSTAKNNKTTKSTKSTKTDQKFVISEELESEKKPSKNNQSTEKKSGQQKSKKPQTKPSWIEPDDDDDFVSDLKDLPTKFQQTIIPDLERISTTSKIYITKANKEITKGLKPYVRNKYAPTIATLLSCAFLVIPLLLVSLIFNRIKAYFSLQKLLIFIQVYLSIYFSILCFSSLISGLEPLKFLYATSQTTYVCLQVLQTLGYVLYLLMLLMYLILVFSTECGPGSRMVGLAQTFVGFAVGLHYYVTVFHRVVLRQPPKMNWKIHGIYATCFLLSCVIAKADRRKKAYMEDGGEEGKKN
ncbi:cell wall protein DAN4 [Senna tora]|uniref:Cell wall protein DAN4 n=1 Tax=Senna tora TaxID=362788 RepID=A0A834X7V4_9FABA|nr:cell wall protein DAN4 [Senna tora]